MPHAPLTPQPRLDDLIRAIRQANDDPLAQLADAVVVAGHLEDLADSLIGHFVDQARRSGASWTDIGGGLGVTKQAAQQRFVAKVPNRDPAQDSGFSRFTPRARNALVTAHDAARAAGNAEVDVAHLALGLLVERAAVAARVLAEQGVDLDAAEARVRADLPGLATADVGDVVPYSERARRVLEGTVGEALALQHNYVGTEHLLLAVLAEDPDAFPGARPDRDDVVQAIHAALDALPDA